MRTRSGGLLHFWINTGVTYRRLKDDETKRQKTVRLGVQSILATVFASALTILFAWGFLACLTYITGDSKSAFILPLIGCIVCAGCTVAVFFSGYVSALIALIYQLRLNRRAVGYVALVLWLIGLIAAIVVVAVLATR